MKMQPDYGNMKILLDQSPRVIDQKSNKFDFELWQLRTPLTAYKLSDRPYGLDNGCFSTFREVAWLRLLGEARKKKPLFVCLPDVVGDARRTLELFQHFEEATKGLPRALVLQDGIGELDIPWMDIDAVFIGGSDAFKTSLEAINAAKTANMMGKWVHVGRVNTVDRVRNWLGLANSIDGSGISRYDHMLSSVIAEITGNSA
jgi:hypothetical protein